MDRRRTFITPTKNSFASDYINNKRAKVKFAGTSNLANNVAQQGGMFPLRTPSGHLKPYQGTYGFSSATSTQGAPPSAYCLNQARSYNDLLDITMGKYLLTPPNPTTNFINLNQINGSSQLYSGTLYQNDYVGISEIVIFNNGITGPTGATGAVNQVIFNSSTTANQWINVDPSYNLFYNNTGCLISDNRNILDTVIVRQNSSAQRQVDRFLNLDLLNGFSYPSKFSLNYNPSECINVNNALQNGVEPVITLEANGVTVKYIGLFSDITGITFTQVNLRGTMEWFAIVNNSSKTAIINYASSGVSVPFTPPGQLSPVPFNNIVTTLMTDMSNIFFNNATFNQLIVSWDTSNVTNMSLIFAGDYAFNQPLAPWNTSKVTNMSNMFEATPFNQYIGAWNTSNVTDMSNMFNNTTAFNQPLSSWNTSNVTTMYYMFFYAGAFNQNISGWNVSSVVIKPPTDFSTGSPLTFPNSPVWT
jgi:surface protein